MAEPETLKAEPETWVIDESRLRFRTQGTLEFIRKDEIATLQCYDVIHRSADRADDWGLMVIFDVNVENGQICVVNPPMKYIDNKIVLGEVISQGEWDSQSWTTCTCEVYQGSDFYCHCPARDANAEILETLFRPSATKQYELHWEPLDISFYVYTERTSTIDVNRLYTTSGHLCFGR